MTMRNNGHTKYHSTVTSHVTTGRIYLECCLVCSLIVLKMSKHKQRKEDEYSMCLISRKSHNEHRWLEHSPLPSQNVESPPLLVWHPLLNLLRVVPSGCGRLSGSRCSCHHRGTGQCSWRCWRSVPSGGSPPWENLAPPGSKIQHLHQF